MQRKTCRICESDRLETYLDLGSTPLANSYLKPDEFSKEQAYPLAVAYCKECHHSQLTEVVPPELMYENYLYVSSTPKTFHDHCRKLVSHTKALLKDSASTPLAMDIASNDGCLLGYFKEAGFKVLGVDPAKNLAAEANAKGVQTICDYWGRAGLASSIAEKHGKADVITATNVFAHVDDVHAFLSGVTQALSPNGLLLIEVPYMVDLVEHCEFDTIYHEHLSYFLLSPMLHAMSKRGLKVVDVSHQAIHGGTMRVMACHREADYAVHPNVAAWVSAEKTKGFHGPELYRSFGKRVEKIQSDLRNLLTNLKAEGKKVCGYGASAKGNTLLNSSRVGRDLIAWIADDNPKKWGFCTPGSHIPITGPEKIAQDHPDHLLLLAWNFGGEIRKRTHSFAAAGGKYITPVPDVEIS